MKASLQCGRAEPLHDSREFLLNRETKKGFAANIDRDRVGSNILLLVDEKGEISSTKFEDIPGSYPRLKKRVKDYYKKKYSEKLEETNKYYRKKGKKDKIKTMSQFMQSRVGKPRQMILQVGGWEEHPTLADFLNIVKRFIKRFTELFGETVHILYAVIHADEATPHAHLTYVADVLNEKGYREVNMTRALEERYTGKIDRFNNPLKHFTGLCRYLFEKITEEELGIELDKERIPAMHLSVKDYKQKKRLEEEISRLENQKNDIAEQMELLNEQIRAAEAAYREKSKRAARIIAEAEKEAERIRAEAEESVKGLDAVMKIKKLEAVVNGLTRKVEVYESMPGVKEAFKALRGTKKKER